jgi:hypothetical protein
VATQPLKSLPLKRESHFSSAKRKDIEEKAAITASRDLYNLKVFIFETMMGSYHTNY